MEEDEDEPVFMVKCEDIHREHEKSSDNEDEEKYEDNDVEDDEDYEEDNDEKDDNEDIENDDDEESMTKEELQEYFVLKSEILSTPREPSKNTSFKKYTIHKKHNVTSKSRNKKSA